VVAAYIVGGKTNEKGKRKREGECKFCSKNEIKAYR
jgi:hypothetical protein